MSEQQNDAQTVEKGIPERPGCGIWFATYFLTALITGSFFVVGLFATYGLESKSDILPLVLMGILPALACGGVAGGFAYAIYPPVRWKAVLMGLFLILLPMQVIALLFPPEGVSPSFAPLLITPFATLGAGAVVSVIISVYRQRGSGAVKGPKGSWEEWF